MPILDRKKHSWIVSFLRESYPAFAGFILNERSDHNEYVYLFNRRVKYELLTFYDYPDEQIIYSKKLNQEFRVTHLSKEELLFQIGELLRHDYPRRIWTKK